MKINRSLAKSTAVAALGGLLFVHERPDLRHISAGGGLIRRLSVCFFFDHDGCAVFRGVIRLSGNERLHPGRDAERTAHRMTSEL